MNPIQSSSDPNAPRECPGDEPNLAPQAANDSAIEPSGAASPESLGPPPARRSRFRKMVYYWVLSRF